MTNINYVAVFAVAYFALSPGMQSVPPPLPPDGGYPEGGLPCGTKSEDPLIAARVQKALDQFRELQPESRGPGTVTIQVYFHVINTGQGIENGNVSDSMLDEQLRVLNDSFSGPPDERDTPFRFVKAGTDRTTNAAWYTMRLGSPEEREAKNILRVGGSNVLNFYTVDSRAQGFGGWGTPPWLYNSDQRYDGVVCLFSTLPGGDQQGYNEDKVGAHEVGHWLGLFHTFEGGCTEPGDYISDTPQEDSPAYGCPMGRDTCPDDPGFDPIENFMDYSPDPCRRLFTRRQAFRMDSMSLQYRMGTVFFADVNGDGKADAIVVNSDAVTVRKSTGSRFGAPSAWTTNPYYGERGTFFADVTGDNRADAIVVNNDHITVRRSDGTRFLPNEDWTNEPYYGERGTFFADVTGDGRADAIVVNNDHITVRRSNGNRFVTNEDWTSEPYYGERGTFFADVTGDGRADAIVVNNGKITVRRSNGTRFLPNEDWTSEPYYGERGTFFADIDGNGAADAIAVNNTRILVRRSSYLGFFGAEIWSGLPYYGQRGTFFADVTGPSRTSPLGTADAIVVNNGTVSVRRSSFIPPFSWPPGDWTHGPYYGEYGDW